MCQAHDPATLSTRDSHRFHVLCSPSRRSVRPVERTTVSGCQVLGIRDAKLLVCSLFLRWRETRRLAKHLSISRTGFLWGPPCQEICWQTQRLWIRAAHSCDVDADWSRIVHPSICYIPRTILCFVPAAIECPTRRFLPWSLGSFRCRYMYTGRFKSRRTNLSRGPGSARRQSRPTLPLLYSQRVLLSLIS
jgi:hypothetical protein